MIDMRNSRSFRQKLFVGVLITTISALLIAGIAMVVYELHDYRERLVEDLSTQGKLLGLASASALQFGDAKLATESLALIEARPQILAAAIYNAQGVLFASYHNHEEDTGSFPARAEAEHVQVVGDQLILVQRLVDHNEVIGSIYLKAHYQLYARIWQYTGIVCGAMVIALVISTFLSLWLQAKVTSPILGITQLARQVTEQRNYDLRAEKTSNDEIGYLVDAFNELLSEVGQRSTALESSNKHLQQEILEHEESDRALQLSERRHRSLVNALASVVWMADAEGHFVDAQQPWSNYTGQTFAQYREKGWHDAIHPDDRLTLQQAWSETDSPATRWVHEIRLWHAASAAYHYVTLCAVPLQNEKGQLLEWTGTADDIDDRRRAELEILRLNAELEQRVAERTAELERANKELEAFSYSVSHDLRTPLRAIDGFSQALLEDYGNQLDDTGHDYLARVRSGAQRMGRLIDDLLKLARVSRSTLNKEQIDLSVIAQEIIEDLRTEYPERKADVKITSKLTAIGDAHLMRIALENLLNNAWKYSSRRELAKIEFGLRSYKGHVCFFVQDNGAGFDMAYAGKLFGAFQRLHDTKDFPGTGVGLATVQRIIHRQGGQIWAEAEVDKGSVFYFTLPSEEGYQDERQTDFIGGRQSG